MRLPLTFRAVFCLSLLAPMLFVVGCGDDDDTTAPPTPVGACCSADGTCQVLTESQCSDSGSADWTRDGACDPNPCLQATPTGACCSDSGECQVLTLDVCTALGGPVDWRGDVACDPNPCPQPSNTGTLRINIGHAVDGVDLMFNNVDYINEAGNQYEVTKLQYYLSDFILQGDGDPVPFDIVHYVDADPNTGRGLTLEIREIDPGQFDTLSFTFGLNETRNIPGGLPAEIYNDNMIWPDILGGGYHYMKLEGFFLNEAQERTGFLTHVGRKRDMQTGEVFPHFFTVSLPRNIAIVAGETSQTEIVMDINQWYENPHVINLVTHSGGIMADTAMQDLLEANGASVFRPHEN